MDLFHIDEDTLINLDVISKVERRIFRKKVQVKITVGSETMLLPEEKSKDFMIAMFRKGQTVNKQFVSV